MSLYRALLYAHLLSTAVLLVVLWSVIVVQSLTSAVRSRLHRAPAEPTAQLSSPATQPAPRSAPPRTPALTPRTSDAAAHG